jgi:hypothetical protein
MAIMESSQETDQELAGAGPPTRAPREEVAARLRRALRAPREHQLLYVAAALGLADLLAAGPRSSADLARAAGAHPQALRRALRGMVAMGLLTERDDGRFGLAPPGACLRREAPGSLRGEALLAGECFAAWGALLHTVRTGETAFERARGVAFFAHFAGDPELARHLHRDMARQTGPIAAAVAAAYDFSAVRTLVDVGGGHGALLAAVLRRYPAVRGVLFDTPGVAAGARGALAAAGGGARCAVVGGDFFAGVPAGGDVYALQAVLHDWDDARARRILAGCRAALPHRGVLLVVERLLPARVADAPGLIEADLNMLVLTGGRERTAAEYAGLLQTAGLRLERTIPLRGLRDPWAVLESRPDVV